MSLLIGVPREVFPGEKRVATVPDVVEKLIKLGFRVAVESGAGDAANFSRRHLPRRRRRGRGRPPPSCGRRPTSSSRCARRAPTKWRMLREGGDADRLHLAGAEPRADAAARRAGRRPCSPSTALPRQLSRAQKMDALTSMAGISGYRAVIEAAQRLRPLLQRPDHRRGQDPAGQGLRRRRRRGGARRDRHRGQPGRDRARQRHARRGRRPGRVAGRRVRQGRLRGGRLRRRRLRQGDERGLPEGPARDVREAGEGGRHHHHHRADPRQARAQAHHRRDGADA